MTFVAACSSGSPAPEESSEPNTTLSKSPTAGTGWTMPDEGDPHTRTWMSFAASEDIWGADLQDTVRRNLAAIAAAIVRFEPVTMLVNPSEVALAKKYLDPKVEIKQLSIDDLWIRDTGAVFVKHGEKLGGVDFNFNGWGDKQEHAKDAKVAAEVAKAADAEPLTTELVLEGGALEVDGRGTAIITESCVINKNRNPGWTKPQVEAELSRLLGIRKVIWLPGIAGKDITDGHTDFYARFAEPGVVVANLDNDPESYDHAVTRKHLDILKKATDASGKALKIVTLSPPDTLRQSDPSPDLAAGYINFYLCNGAVIAPQFGDADADKTARDTLADLFPDREVVQVNIDGIASGGGGIHCSTQQQPA